VLLCYQKTIAKQKREKTMFKLTNNAIERINQIITSKSENLQKFLRITVDSGGCNGFQYVFVLDNIHSVNDILFYENNKIIAVTDETSINFLENAEIDFIKELGASYFKVNNPNASSKCGCGSSFSV